jgi:hypothetical protein
MSTQFEWPEEFYEDDFIDIIPISYEEFSKLITDFPLE